MDFTIHLEWRGKKIWFRWKDGEITTNEPEALLSLRKIVKMWEREEVFVDGARRTYLWSEAFTNPRAFYVLAGYAGKYLGAEGDVPEFPSSNY